MVTKVAKQTFVLVFSLIFIHSWAFVRSFIQDFSNVLKTLCSKTKHLRSLKWCFVLEHSHYKKMRSLVRRLNWVSRKIRLFVSDGRCTLVMFFFFLLDVSIRMQVKFQSRSDWISNCCLDIRVASQSCLYKCNYFRYFSYCFLVLIKLFKEVLKLSWLN